MLENVLVLFGNISGRMIARSVGEIFLIYIILYTVLRIMQGTSGTSILRGVAFIIVLISVGILFFIRKLQLYTINWLVTEFVPVFIIPMIILFQPEFRRALFRLGQSPVFRVMAKPDHQAVDEILKAVSVLAKKRIGALIAIERESGLSNFIETGIKLNANVTSELLCSVFWQGSPLHDGAVIIRGQKISAAGCLFPLTGNKELSKDLGTRHRAAVGLTEETDAIVIVVSEETGNVSAAYKGTLNRGVDERELKRILNELSSERFSISRTK
ncbi:MAG: TIGR00159 family protein [Planctomycetes bacterium]|nr:TIGR00159 family protein [Planctomycetota bacterium]